jgi:solute carrier family 35 protein F1/2
VHAQDRSSGGSNIILGDILVLLSATLYAIMHVSEEFVVKSTGDQVEYLAHIGFFGALISVGQIYLLEWEGLQSIHWTVNSISALVASAFTNFWFASSLPLLLRMSGATMMKLSLLTSDMWAVAIQALIFAEVVDNLYFIAFGTVAAGLIVYAIAGELSNDPLLGRGGASSALVHHEDYKYTRIEQLQREVTTEPAEVEEPLLQSR